MVLLEAMKGKKLEIAWQEDEGTLRRLYKAEQDRQTRSRLQMLWLLRRGVRLKEAAETVGIHYRTAIDWVNWYRRGGIAEIRQHRKGGLQGTRRTRLTGEQEEALRQRATDEGFKTAREAAAWVKEQFGVIYTHWGMRHVFRRLKLRKKVPRPMNIKASPAAQAAWKGGA